MPRVAKKTEHVVEVETEVETPAPAPKKRVPRSKAVETEESVTVTKTRRTRTRKDKDPNAPKKPLNAYILFTQDFRKTHEKELKAQGKTTEQGKYMGLKYKELKANEKAKYTAQADKLKAVYEKELAAYNASH